MTMYAGAIDPVLIYTFIFSHMYTMVTVYRRPVIQFSYTQLYFHSTPYPRRKIKCIYENWISHDYLHCHQ